MTKDKKNYKAHKNKLRQNLKTKKAIYLNLNCDKTQKFKWAKLKTHIVIKLQTQKLK